MDFEESGYVVTEGESVEVCALLTGELEREAMVNISAVEGTALGIQCVYCTPPLIPWVLLTLSS